jgi:hypothetical protein
MSTPKPPATLHLMKLAVGCDTPEDLAARQAGILARERRLLHRTRQCPRRRAELLAGGSLYWVIRGRILLRQRVLGVEQLPPSGDGGRSTLFLLDPQLVSTEAKAQRPFQGWRYLSAAAAPRDLPPFAAGERQCGDAMPADMQAELRALGLL